MCSISSSRCRAALFAVILLGHSSPCLSQLSNDEQSNAFCVGVLDEMMEYYNRHPQFFILSPFAHEVIDSMSRRLKILEVTGLSHAKPWRSTEALAMTLRVEDSGMKERKECEERTYPCFGKCLGALPSPSQSRKCRLACEWPDHFCASSFSCLQ
jgi:hypothetical protein